VIRSEDLGYLTLFSFRNIYRFDRIIDRPIKAIIMDTPIDLSRHYRTSWAAPERVVRILSLAAEAESKHFDLKLCFLVFNFCGHEDLV